MSQNDFTIANQGFPAFRADLNSALQALASNSSGATAPSTTFANMWWYDSANNIMYIRNEDNDAWIKFAELDQTNDKFVLSGTLQLDDGTVSAPALTFNSDTNMGIYRGGTDILKFVTAGTDAITIDASQNVGIGTSPATILHIKESSPIFTQETTGNVTTGGVAYQQVKDVSGSSVFTQGFAGLANCYQFGTSISNGFMRFLTGSAAERMRIDASGNLLVGKTNTSFSNAGVRILPTGNIYPVADGSAPLEINRLSSDGDIVKIYKDGSTVGSIGTNSSYMVIGSPVGGGAYLLIGNSLIHPATSIGGTNDNVIDIGGSGNRFKDLYLSGGVVFGDAGGSGTSTSNKLDSYEEGTFTPGLIDSGGGLGANLTTQVGQYTKVGNLVTFALRINGDARTSTNNQVYITGLPFTFSPSSTVNRIQFEVNGINLGLDSGMYGIVGQLANADTSLTLLMQGTSIDNFRGHDLTPSYEIYVHGAYFTT